MKIQSDTQSAHELAHEISEMKKRVNDICAEMEAKVKAYGEGRGIISFFGKDDHEGQLEYVNVFVALDCD